jgi:glycosyltransferase involved in cell wall biosynthesis
MAVAAIIPAKDEADRIAATVTAVRQLAEVDLVIVVDDGSTDDTGEIARAAGAFVARHRRNRGKAAAMMTGAAHVARRDTTHPAAAGDARALLFVDADLEESASALAALVPPVTSDRADMTIAVLPPQRRTGGGRGLVVGLAREGIADLTGWTLTQPLSGMRCLSRRAFEAARPLARGWGVETGLTIDVLDHGLRIEEVRCALHHRVTGSDWRGQLHRGAQYRDVWLALTTRRLARARRRLASQRPG